jgi:hypothetical protein
MKNIAFVRLHYFTVLLGCVCFGADADYSAYTVPPSSGGPVRTAGQQPIASVRTALNTWVKEYLTSIKSVMCSETIVRTKESKSLDILEATVSGDDAVIDLVRNKKPIKSSIRQLSGLWSVGELASSVRDLEWAIDNDALTFRDWRILDGEPVALFEYGIELGRSQWDITVRGKHFFPGYRVRVEVAQSGAVTRLERSSQETTSDFPLREVTWIVDFDRMASNGSLPAMPHKGQYRTCNQGDCRENHLSFSGCRRVSTGSEMFVVDSSISFDR